RPALPQAPHPRGGASRCGILGASAAARVTRESLIAELTALICEVTDKNVVGAPLAADEPIFGSGTRLALDSLDALQVSMALQKRYRIRLVDSKETRRILSCVGNLADHLLEQRLA